MKTETKKRKFWERRLFWAIGSDILVIGFMILATHLGGTISSNVTWQLEIVYWTVCLVGCFPIAYGFFWTLDHMSSGKK